MEWQRNVTHLRWPCLLLLCLGVPACEGPAGSGSELEVNSRSEIEQLPDWSLADDAEVRVGVMQGEPTEVFGSIQDGALGPHGMYLLDRLNAEVRIFDRSGRHVMSLGGKGEGPGEFQNPNRLIVGLDSTVSVWDRALRRLTTFGHDGGVVRTATVRQRVMNPSFQSILPDGSFVVSEFRYPPDPFEEGTGPLPIMMYSADGELLDTLDVLTGPRPTGIDLVPRPFTNPDLVASAREGVWAFRVDTALIALIGPGGDTLQTVTWEPLDRRVTEADLDAYEAWRVEGVEDPEVRDERIRQLREPGYASKRHPTAVRFRSDGIGRLWLVERHPWHRIQAPTWLIFDPSGRVIGRWEEPEENLSLLDADEEMALIRRTDELGLHKVELREMIKGGGADREAP